MVRPMAEVSAGRVGLVLYLTAAVIAAVAYAGNSWAQAATERPNIIVLMSDDQDVASMKVMANVLELLANQG
jgi:hypothetical protein